MNETGRLTVTLEYRPIDSTSRQMVPIDVQTHFDLLIGRADGIPVPFYHGYIRSNGDGTHAETKVSLT